MIKKDSVIKKIASYSALASSVLAGSEAHAQILYHKITPYDTIPPYQNHITLPYYIDLNGDGVEDFALSVTSRIHGASSSAEFNFDVVLHRENTNDRIDAASRYYVSALQSGQSIGKNGHWKDSLVYGGLFEVDYSTHSDRSFSFIRGNWKNQLDKFVGLRIKNKTTGNFNYGWLRLSVEFFKSNEYFLEDTAFIVVKDYAYEQTPNKPIIAGDVGNCTPAVSLFVSGHKTFPIGDSAKLNVLGFRKGDVITWLRNGDIIKTDSDKSLIVKEHGLYSALVKNKDGCGQVTDSVQIKTFMPENSTTVIDESSAGNSDIYVYNKTLFGRLNNKDLDQASIIIYNELGEEVLKQNIGAGNFTLNLQSLPTGIYFVQILNGGQMEGKKIFVE